jgi:hypothetical protein
MNTHTPKVLELIYGADPDGDVDWLYRNEVESMRAAGLNVRLEPSPAATHLLRRGPIVDEEDYPKDSRYLQNAHTYTNHCRIDRWYPLIESLTIPTVFCKQLGANALKRICAQGWSRCFVKNAVKSLVEKDPLESAWPGVSFETMAEKFSQNPRKGPYALREYYAPERFREEKRYWGMGTRIHHSSGRTPEIVFEERDRLAEFGGVFYTIDATPELIVEINSGESADRKTDNTAGDFAAWIRETFGCA